MENKKFKHFHTDINVSPISLLINCDGWVDYWIGKACDVESFDILVSVVNEYDMQYCFEGKRLEKGNENAWNKIVDKTIPLEEVIKKSRELGKDVINTYLENYSKLKDLSDENVAELFLKLFKLGVMLCSYGYIGPIVDLPKAYLSEKLGEILDKRNARGEIIFLSESSMEKYSDIAKKELMQTIIDDGDLNSWLSKWFWINFGNFGPGFNIEKLNEEYGEFIEDKEKAKKELERIVNDRESLKERQEKRFDELGLSDEEKYFFYQAQKITFLKAFRLDLLFCIWGFFDKIFDIYSEKLGLDKDVFRFLVKEDVAEVITGKKIVDGKEILKRKDNSVWITKPEGTKILVGEDADKYVKENIEFEEVEEIEDTDEIRGNIAFPGKVSGMVKIIRNIKDMENVEEGNILVAIQTAPEFLPAMKKAAAFVTDVGGLTCHAAIVAREMKKPGIIGTKIATRLLKDGDMVEVDADKGIVKIIRK